MPSSSDNSFIPKRGPVKRKQSGSSRQVYIFTYVSYILMFSTLLATGGVFLYGQYIDRQLDEEIAALNTEIGSFSGENLAKVTEFDLRLQQADYRLQNSVSVASVFEALQSATIDTVQIEKLNLTRENDEKFVLDASILTDSFDSTIFQRGVFGRSDVISDEVVIENVNTNTQSNLDTGGSVVSSRPVVNFSAVLEVPLDTVPYVPTEPQSNQQLELSQPVVETFEEEAGTSTQAENETLEETNPDSV